MYLPPLPPLRYAQKGHVYLVGAGLGSPDLLTLRGWALLASADVAVVDALADPALYADLSVRIVLAGKRGGDHGMKQPDIHRELIILAQQGLAVVRLKGGDPFVFGRGSEEAMALAAAGVPCEVVPGISSALAGPGLAGIPLTHRGLAEAFTVVSAHLAEGVPSLPAYDPRTTLVVLMGVANRDHWLPTLQTLGYPPQLPMAWVVWAGRPEQQVVRSTVAGALVDATAQRVRSPAVAIFGPVVALELP